MKRVLVGIVTIDQDRCFFEKLHDNISESLRSVFDFELLVVTREQDVATRDFWGKREVRVRTVPNYSIESRHNIGKIALKRNTVMDHAAQNGFDAVFFIDSDVLISQPIALDVLECSKRADVVVVPYEIAWSKQCTVGRLSRTQFGRIDFADARELMQRAQYPSILGGPAGCTFIQKTAFDVRFEELSVGGVPGEDIGFFLNCFKRGSISVRTTSWPHIAQHLYQENRERPFPPLPA